VAQQDVRLRRVRLREVWRQTTSAGVRERGGRSANDSGAPGPAHGRCAAGPGARTPSGRGVLRLKPPGPRVPSPCRAPHGRAARAGVYSKRLRGFSTRLAHGSGGPRQRPSSAPPLQHSPSTRPLFRLCAIPPPPSPTKSSSCSPMPPIAWWPMARNSPSAPHAPGPAGLSGGADGNDLAPADRHWAKNPFR
jgi:hypothetical protein